METLGLCFILLMPDSRNEAPVISDCARSVVPTFTLVSESLSFSITLLYHLKAKFMPGISAD